MAEVFLARLWGHGGFFRDVVIKRLFAHYAEHEHALRMFQDEARLLTELSHPNIPQVYDLGYSDGHWFLAMEHVGGTSLAELCAAATNTRLPMPLAVGIGITAQICAALHHAHERRDRQGRPLRIVHRDVTPYNIMISPDAVVKVLDFGVAQTSARLDTDVGAVRGTYAYMAPEQVRGLPLDRRADVFALGINLYELTTGQRLFRGSDVEAMTAIVERDVPPPSTIRPNYPPELEAIVMKALQRDPDARTPSAAHLAHSLDEFCMQHGLLTGPLVVAQYERQVFPYESAQELGLGADVGTEFEDLSDQELEERLLVEELRALRASQRYGLQDLTSEVEELSLDDLLIEEDETDVLPPQAQGPDAKPVPKPPARLDLGAFDEDSNVKPVVLLTSKPSTDTGLHGSFLGDLERRLEEDTETRDS